MNMEPFDYWPPLQNFSFKEFTFPVDRYTEWENGRIIDTADVHFDVVFKYSTGSIFNKKVSIDVRINNNPIPNKLMSDFRFDRATTSGDRILFYIASEETNSPNNSIAMLTTLLGPTRHSKCYENNEPIIASVFTINKNIAKISFALGNPDRLIELY